MLLWGLPGDAGYGVGARAADRCGARWGGLPARGGPGPPGQDRGVLAGLARGQGRMMPPLYWPAVTPVSTRVAPEMLPPV